MVVQSVCTDWEIDKNPLRDSLLYTLDVGGGLSVPLDRVGEDGVLCAALACNTFATRCSCSGGMLFVMKSHGTLYINAFTFYKK
eukprot:COSAG02_NODE_3143_length_7292_cov_20.803698_8_plen_84_part_00